MSTSGTGHGRSVVVHKSITALLGEHPGEANPERLIRKLARAKVLYAKLKGWRGPPFCPKEFASIFGIRCKEVHHDIGADGRILLHPGDVPFIEYRSGRLLERQRFTIFHEVAHTLFPDFCTFVPAYHAARTPMSDQERKFEHLCDIAAAEMLFPLEDFAKDLSSIKWFGFESIHRLRHRYTASIDATLYRLTEVCDKLALAAVFLTDQKMDFDGPGPLWVNHSSRNSLFKGFIRSGALVPRQSVATQCYRNNTETTDPVKETWWINGKPRSWLVQAAKLPNIPDNPAYPKIVAILMPGSHVTFWSKES